MLFKHYLHTGFNVPVYSNRIPVEEWIDYRLPVFEDITLPSIKNQTCKNFEWIVFFGNQTSQKLREKIQKWEEEEIMTAVFLPEKRAYIPYFNSLKSKPFEYLLSSRCDNDDALAFNFIQTVQDNFEEVEEMAIDILYGCKWLYNSQRFRTETTHGNPFISIIEKNDGRDFKPARTRKHTFIHEELKKVKIVANTSLAWLRGIHQQNVVSSFQKKQNILPKKELCSLLKETFNITKEPEHEFLEPANAKWEGTGKNCKYIRTLRGS